MQAEASARHSVSGTVTASTVVQGLGGMNCGPGLESTIEVIYLVDTTSATDGGQSKEVTGNRGEGVVGDEVPVTCSAPFWTCFCLVTVSIGESHQFDGAIVVEGGELRLEVDCVDLHC